MAAFAVTCRRAIGRFWAPLIDRHQIGVSADVMDDLLCPLTVGRIGEHQVVAGASQTTGKRVCHTAGPNGRQGTTSVERLRYRCPFRRPDSHGPLLITIGERWKMHNSAAWQDPKIADQLTLIAPMALVILVSP